MIHLEKLLGQINALKTSNEVMKKQIEIQNRTIELLVDLITEPESLIFPPLSKEQIEDFKKQFNNFNTANSIVNFKEVERTNIKPEDMKAGEWYLCQSVYGDTWIFKFKNIIENMLYKYACMSLKNKINYIDNSPMGALSQINSIRKATREQVLRYFPNEFEIPTHGGNDIPNIPQVTDEQL